MMMTHGTLELFVTPDGNARCLYGEALNLTAFGSLQIERASHVEPDESGRWSVDLSPVDGPRLGPYLTRSHALSVEAEWLLRHRLSAAGTQPTSTRPENL